MFPPVEDVSAEEQLAADGAGGVSPVHEEHEHHAEHGGDQGHPLVVVLSTETCYGDLSRTLNTTLNEGLQLGALV